MSRHFSPTSLRDIAVDLLTSLYISGRELVARRTA
jgi:hypothetical protein